MSLMRFDLTAAVTPPTARALLQLSTLGYVTTITIRTVLTELPPLPANAVEQAENHKPGQR